MKTTVNISLTVIWECCYRFPVQHCLIVFEIKHQQNHSFLRLSCLSLSLKELLQAPWMGGVVHDSGQFCQGPPPPYHLSGVQVTATVESVEPLLVLLRTAPSPADCYRGDNGRRHSLIKGPQCYHFNDKN